MRKILGIVVIAASMLTVTVAEAQHRRNNHGGHGGYNNHGGHGGYGGRNIMPWILGGAAVGILGAGMYYHNNRRCWIENREIFDRWGYFRGYHGVQVCN